MGVCQHVWGIFRAQTQAEVKLGWLHVSMCK